MIGLNSILNNRFLSALLSSRYCIAAVVIEMEPHVMSKERRLKALQEGQFYFFTNLQKVVNDLLEVCHSLRDISFCIKSSIAEKSLTLNSLSKMIVAMDYLEVRIRDNLTKLIQCMRHMIVMFDHVMFVLEANARQEFEAVKEMMNKVLEPQRCKLSQSTMDLVARRARLTAREKHSCDSTS